MTPTCVYLASQLARLRHDPLVAESDDGDVGDVAEEDEAVSVEDARAGSKGPVDTA